MQMRYAANGIISIIHGKRSGGDENDRDAVRQGAWPDGYYAVKSPPTIVLLT